MSRNIRALSARRIKAKTLFEALRDTADQTGSPSAEQLRLLAKERLVSPAALLGASSFYDFLNNKNQGKLAYICNGTSCRLSGKQKTAYSVLASKFSDSEIGTAACVGHCYHGGAYWVGDRTYDSGHAVDAADEANPIPFYSRATNTVFSEDISDLEYFYRLALVGSEKIIDELQHSQLRGRGGAGFPFADKLETCAKAASGEGGQKYVVCNGDEGDPGAFSDRYLMEQNPHRVLAGMLAAGVVTGADTGFVYIRAEYPLAPKCMAEAIAVFESTSVFKQTGFEFRIVRGAGSYICGEETALLNSIEGLRPEVRTRPPYPAQEGLFGQPTLLSNVETFAAIPWILEHGGAAFAKLGTEKCTGTKLLSLDSQFNIPGVHEVNMGVALAKVINDYGSGFRAEVKAVQIGGPLGSVVPVDKIKELTLDFESFAQHGFLLGHAGVIGIPKDYPMINLLRHLFSYMANESCGKCLPCRLGTAKGKEMLVGAAKNSPVDRSLFDDLLKTLEDGSLCGLGAGLPLPVRNILQYFSSELEEYFQ